MIKTQMQIFWAEHRKISDANDTFLDLVKGGMTRAELEKNIAKRPGLWARFSNWLDKLP